MREEGGFERCGDVGTDSQPNVERFLQGYKFDGARGFQISARLSKVHGEAAAFLYDAQARPPVLCGNDLIGLFVRVAPELQRSKSIAVGNRVGVGLTGI